MYKLKIINSIEDFKNVENEWQNLIKELNGDISVFDSYSWYEIWWRHYANGARLHIVTMWDSNKLIGVLPIMKRRSNHNGIPVNAICFLENRNSLSNNMIVLPPFREEFISAVFQHLYNGIEKWNIIILNNLPISHCNHKILINILNEKGRKWQQNPTFASPYICPATDWEEYLSNRSNRTRKTLRNIMNNILKTGEVKIGHIQSWDEYQESRGDIYNIAKHCWTEKIGDSLVSPVNKGFFDDLARIGAENEWLSVWTLRLNGEMIAFEFHLRAFGKEHAMRGSYLPEYAHLSPGTYLEMQILKHIFEEKERVKIYDFGGSFDQYKRKWTDLSVPHCEITIFNDNLYSRFAKFHETRTVPFARKVRDKLKNSSLTGKLFGSRLGHDGLAKSPKVIIS